VRPSSGRKEGFERGKKGGGTFDPTEKERRKKKGRGRKKLQETHRKEENQVDMKWEN